MDILGLHVTGVGTMKNTIRGGFKALDVLDNMGRDSRGDGSFLSGVPSRI